MNKEWKTWLIKEENISQAVGFVVIAVFLLVGYLLGQSLFGEKNDYHITWDGTHYDNYGMKAQDGLTNFYLLNSNNFWGYAQLQAYGDAIGNVVLFTLKNKGKESWDFKNANYYMVDKDDAKIRLEFGGIVNKSFPDKSFVLIPGQKEGDFQIECILPSNGTVSKLSDIKGFYIDLNDDVGIKFGYQILNTLQKLWFEISGPPMSMKDGSVRGISDEEYQKMLQDSTMKDGSAEQSSRDYQSYLKAIGK